MHDPGIRSPESGLPECRVRSPGCAPVLGVTLSATIYMCNARSCTTLSGTDMNLFVLFCCYLSLALACAAHDINLDDQNHGKSRDRPLLMLAKQTQSGACL